MDPKILAGKLAALDAESQVDDEENENEPEVISRD